MCHSSALMANTSVRATSRQHGHNRGERQRVWRWNEQSWFMENHLKPLKIRCSSIWGVTVEVPPKDKHHNLYNNKTTAHLTAANNSTVVFVVAHFSCDCVFVVWLCFRCHFCIYVFRISVFPAPLPLVSLFVSSSTKSSECFVQFPDRSVCLFKISLLRTCVSCCRPVPEELPSAALYQNLNWPLKEKNCV